MAKKVQKRYLFPSDYMADPSVHVFDGKLYIYPSHDWESAAPDDDFGSEYDMKDYHVLSLEGPDPMTSPVKDIWKFHAGTFLGAEFKLFTTDPQLPQQRVQRRGMVVWIREIGHRMEADVIATSTAVIVHQNVTAHLKLT